MSSLFNKDLPLMLIAVPNGEDLFIGFWCIVCFSKCSYEQTEYRSVYQLQDIEVGKAVRPQLAVRVGDATGAWKKVLYN